MSAQLAAYQDKNDYIHRLCVWNIGPLKSAVESPAFRYIGWGFLHNAFVSEIPYLTQRKAVQTSTVIFSPPPRGGGRARLAIQLDIPSPSDHGATVEHVLGMGKGTHRLLQRRFPVHCGHGTCSSKIRV